ncbi:MAG: hypothetical protein V3S68_00245, partial [Dehalococcoidia bacterium]
FSDHISDQSVQRYDTFINTGVTGIQRAGVAAPTFGGVGGVIEIAGNDTDEDQFVMSTHGPAFVVSDTVANSRKLWFEARFSKASIGNDALAFFLGLAFDHGAGVTVAKTLCLTNTNANLGAFSYLGFHVDQAAGATLDAVYKAESQSQTVNAAGIQTMVANTYYRLGLMYDPDAPAAKRIKWFVDGVEQSTYVTATQIAAATFPDAEPLAMVLCTKTGETAAVASQMDWWRCAQLRGA